MSTPSRARRYSAALTCFILPFPLAWFFGCLIVAYWDYFDMGVSGARGFVVLVLYCPVALAAFLLVAGVAFFVLRRRGLGPWATCASAVAIMLLVLSVGFVYEVQRTADYPTDPGMPRHTMTDFFLWLLHPGTPPPSEA